MVREKDEKEMGKNVVFAENKECCLKMDRRTMIKGAAGLGVASVGALSFPFGSGDAIAAGPAPKKWHQTTDVIVIGTGFAGYSAAIEAADAGARVVILEKENHVGGNSALSGGACQFAGTSFQALQKVQDRPEWLYEDTLKFGQFRNMPELVKIFSEQGAETSIWLEKLGLVWGSVNQQEDARVPRSHWPAKSPLYAGTSGVSEITILHRAAEQRKIPILLEHRLIKLIRPNLQGPVLGVEATHAGKTFFIRARKGVVLATGGFRANPAILKTVHPLVDEDFVWTGFPYTRTSGEGHIAAEEVGGGLTDMAFAIDWRIIAGSTRYTVWEPPTLQTVPVSGGLLFAPKERKYIVMVENDGRRFMDESVFTSSHLNTLAAPHIIAFLNLPKRPRKVWVIVDSVGAKALNWKTETFAAANPTKAPYLDPKYVGTGDTIAELAGKMDVPAAGLQATIDKYNGFVSAGEDKEFKRPGPLYAITQAPFFAVRLAIQPHNQCGGIRVNTRSQVIDRVQQRSERIVPLDTEHVIPHLYAAGECTGGTFGSERGGGKLGAYMIFGRIAGKNVAAEKS